MRDKKVQWKTEDDGSEIEKNFPEMDYKSGLEFALGLAPQRIRAFKITHTNMRRSLEDDLI